MYENSAELAENKLLVLYVIKSLRQPISKTQLTEIILENNFINYFTLQQYISELETAEFVEYIEKNNKKLITITTKGENVLSIMNSLLPFFIVPLIQPFLLILFAIFPVFTGFPSEPSVLPYKSNLGIVSNELFPEPDLPDNCQSFPSFPNSRVSILLP